MNNAAWNLAELNSHYLAANRRGSNLTPTLISSLFRLIEIFRYHLRLTRDSANGIFNLEEPGGIDNMLLVFGQSEKQDEFERTKIVSEANLIGCIHAARGLFDIFAQLINELILSPKMRIWQVEIKTVTSKLPACRLKTELRNLLKSASFKYVNAFVNTTKHRQLVPHIVHVSFVNNDTGLHLDRFSYGGEAFPT